jgi:DNA-binding NarL/FixJ family response regulator
MNLSDLSMRQRQVVEMRREGMSYREIASQLGVSLTTVKTHMTHVIARLGITDCTSRKTLKVMNALFPAEINEAKLALLNARQRSIARAIFEGKNRKEIAIECGEPNEGTVRNKVRVIFDKIGSSNRAELRNMLSL